MAGSFCTSRHWPHTARSDSCTAAAQCKQPLEALHLYMAVHAGPYALPAYLSTEDECHSLPRLSIHHQPSEAGCAVLCHGGVAKDAVPHCAIVLSVCLCAG